MFFTTPVNTMSIYFAYDFLLILPYFDAKLLIYFFVFFFYERLKITDIAQHTTNQLALILESIDDRLLGVMQQKIQSAEDIHSKLAN